MNINKIRTLINIIKTKSDKFLGAIKKVKYHSNYYKINDPDNKIRDVTNIGHQGVGDYEFKLENDSDMFYFINYLFKQVYNEKIE